MVDITSNALSFLNTELELAATFVKGANLDGEEHKVRNRENARKAYDSVVYFLGKIPFSQSEHADIENRLADLKEDLQSLGEQF